MFRWLPFFLCLFAAPGIQAQQDVLCTITAYDSAQVQVVLYNAVYGRATFNTICVPGATKVSTTDFHPQVPDSIPDWWAEVVDIQILLVPLHLPAPLFILHSAPGSDCGGGDNRANPFEHGFELRMNYQLQPWKKIFAEGWEPKNRVNFGGPNGFFSSVEVHVDGTKKSRQIVSLSSYGTSMQCNIEDFLPTDTMECWLLLLRGADPDFEATIRVPMRSL
ncbi:MAG: hypothetical protein WCV85_01575 [Patescibacteria group bacterium]|jgi:hypothetical protein